MERCNNPNVVTRHSLAVACIWIPISQLINNVPTHKMLLIAINALFFRECEILSGARAFEKSGYICNGPRVMDGTAVAAVLYQRYFLRRRLDERPKFQFACAGKIKPFINF